MPLSARQWRLSERQNIPFCSRQELRREFTRWRHGSLKPSKTGRRTMGLFTRDLKTLEDLFLHGLKDIYYAENQIVKNLPKMIEAASDAELKKALKAHLAETENQVTRLEQVFDLLGENPRGTRCPGIDGILTEGDELLGDVEGRSVTNAAV